MKATDSYKIINNSPLKGIILFYTTQLLNDSYTTNLGSFIKKIQTGKTPPKAYSKYYQDEDVNWFKPSDIGYDKYLDNAREKFSKIAVEEKKATIYPSNSMLMIGIGGGVGRVALLKNESSSNQQITGITFDKVIDPEYAYYYYLVREKYIKSEAKSMSFPILNQAKIQKLIFKAPSIQEQREFVSFIDYCWDSFKNNIIPQFEDFNIEEDLKIYSAKQFQAINFDGQLKTQIKTQKSLLTQLKQAILQEAIQGKLTRDWRAQNSELITGENSAATLLENIKAEKAQLVKEKKIKKEKLLPPIEKKEIPFELPEGWVWCRLGEITTYGSSEKLNQKTLNLTLGY